MAGRRHPSMGAAASLVILLIWVYYSSQIVLLGAAFTRCYAGLRPRPPLRLIALLE
jgi:uncharacterized BrkB/YihY/UPF0761 family membrane protein